jgi:hypothetical protein
MKLLIRNRFREIWPGYAYLLPPHRCRHLPWRWVQAKGDSATLAKIIRLCNLETGNRVSAMYLAELIDIRHERIERAPAFKYRGKPRQLFILNARIRHDNSLARSCNFLPSSNDDG